VERCFLDSSEQATQNVEGHWDLTSGSCAELSRETQTEALPHGNLWTNAAYIFAGAATGIACFAGWGVCRRGAR